MTASVRLDAAGRRPSPATIPGHHCGRPPRNKGLRYPADPPNVEEIVAVMRCAGDTAYGLRARALIVLLWRAGLRISEGLALAESDLDQATGGILIRHGKGGKRRERDGSLRLAAARALARSPRDTARRSVAVRHRRSNRRAAMVTVGGPHHPT
jgi:integrase